MNKYHQEILEEIKDKASGGGYSSLPKNYNGTTHLEHGLTVPAHRQIVKDWIKKHPDLTLPEFIELLNSLFLGESMDEKTTGGKVLEYLPKLRAQVDPNLVDTWLDDLVGWAEIDSFCYGNFTASDLLSKWGIWQELINKLSENGNISKRRASLVFLTEPVRESDDKRLFDLSFEIIDRLKIEKGILITKAISWLLRSLIKNHRLEVEVYLKQNTDTLPKIAIRETIRKIRTGRK